jgi:Family of unknown function (DUF5906)/Domain of unknown function (DUF3854)
MANEPPPNLKPQDLAMFRKIGVDEHLLVMSQVRRVSDAEACELLTRPIDPIRNMAGVEFPYLDPRSGRRVTSRIRRDKPDHDNGKIAAKYMQSGMDRNHLYFPAGIQVLDPARNLIIVEAEKSALAITAWANRSQASFAAVALGGCWGWLGKNGKRPTPEGGTEPEHGPTPDFDYLNGRHIYVLLDSNVHLNWYVQEAELRLVAELRKRGCEVYVAHVPHADNINGPDDLIAARGDEELNRILAEAKVADSLEAFNDEFAFIRDTCAVVALRSMNVLTVERFKHLTANRFHIVKKIMRDGTEGNVRKPLAEDWLKWHGRREFEKMIYEPAQPALMGDDLNRWRGWGAKAKPGDIHPWATLLNHLFGESTPERKWFEQWCAYPLQHPGTKLSTAVILWGNKQGTGKTTLAETLCRIYGANAARITEQQLTSAFNDWARDRQFVVADEVTGGDKRAVADRLKLMITNQELNLNRKYEPGFSVRDTINYLFTSNHCNSFYLEETDRRYFVHEVTIDPQGESYFDIYYEWLNHEGPSYLFDHLSTLDLSGFHPYRHAPVTEAKREMIELGRSELERWTIELKEDPEELCALAGHVWEARELLAQFDPTGRTKVGSGGMGAAMKRAGFSKDHLKVRGNNLYLWALTDEWKTKPHIEWAEEYLANASRKPNPTRK